MRKSKTSTSPGALASLARLGPGLITGVADDDPSGIATYSQAGAQFGLNTLGFTKINPIKALFYSAVINGVVAVPRIVLILLLAARTSVLGSYRARGMLLGLGWIPAAVMALSVAGMLIPLPQ